MATSSTRAVAHSTLVLRILTLLLLIASVVIMALDSYKLSGVKTTWKDLKTYRFVLATAVIGVAYTLIQLPFAFYHACMEKRLIRHSCLPEFDFYADKLISYLLATAFGAGIAASVELKENIDGFVGLIDLILAAVTVNLGFDADQFKSKTHKFLNRGIEATCLLALGFVCMAVISVLSSLNRPRNRTLFG